MDFSTGFEDVGWPRDNIDEHFVARSEEISRLREHYQSRGGVIFLTGLGGAGKTSLVREYLATARTRTPPLYIHHLTDTRDPVSEVQQRLQERREREEIPEIVAIDNMDPIVSGAQAEQISRAVLNYKRVRSLIFVARHVPDLAKWPTITLSPLNEAASRELLDKLLKGNGLPVDTSRLIGMAEGNPLVLNLLARTLKHKTVDEIERFLKGELYSTGKDLLLPERKLIEVAKPKLILTGKSLADRLKSNPKSVHDLSPREYETLLAELLDGMGYEVELTPQTRDGGKDIMAYMNTPHGRLLCLVEAKKYRPDRPVGVGLVRELYGTFVDSRATNAMLVTTSTFSKDAKAFQSKHEYQLALRDYDSVVQWIEDHKD